MSWNGHQFSKPCIFLHQESLADTMMLRGYAPEDEVQELFPTDQIGNELALQILLMHGKTEAAVNLLSACLIPRVGVWWAYLCLQLVQDDIQQDLAKDGCTPTERRQKSVDALAAKLTDTSGIEQDISERMKSIEQLRSELEEKVKNRDYLTPDQRLEVKLNYIRQFMEQMRDSLPQDVLGDPNAPLPMEDVVKQFKEMALRELDQYHESLTPKPEAEHPLSFGPVYRALEEKTQAIKPALDEEMGKHFPLKLKGLPPLPSASKKAAAVQAALRWLLVPSDENGQLACQAAIAAKSGPESMLAYAAFWSSTNLKTETGIAPTNPALPPIGVSKTLLQLALQEGGEMDYDERYRRFLELGIECADGTCTWDEHGQPVRTDPTAPASNAAPADDSVFHARSGFGRHA